jgi:2-C-methyl-D-erythritol 4-phosphate cytidylyltransferase
MNVSIILAAGNSTRFTSNKPKQLFEINGKPIIQHSIDIIENHVDDIIVVTNSKCNIQSNHQIVINDIDSRIQSIKAAVDTISKKYQKIIIHDAARPFITDVYISNLIKSKSQHSQYYLKLSNGLAMKNEIGWEIPNREDFIELCSPQCTDFDLFRFIFKTYIETGKQCEILPCLSYLEIQPELIEGHYKYLRKINTLDDIY